MNFDDFEDFEYFENSNKQSGSEKKEQNEDTVLFESNAMDDKQKDFYQKIRVKINNYVEEHPNSKYVQYLVLVPDLFHLMCKLVLDPDVSLKNKAILGVAIAYFVSPIDLIPDFLIGIGQMDDISVAVTVINKILKDTDKNIIEKHWAGEGNIFEQLESALKFTDSIIGSGGIKKIKNMFLKD